MDLKSKIRNIKDFPEKGIIFRDITTLIGDGQAYHAVIKAFVEKLRPLDVDAVAVLDARGFLVGPPVAYELEKGLVPLRKTGKLPAETYRVEYDLEYGSAALEMHKDAIKPGARVAILDDLLATGGTAKAAQQLIEMAGGKVVFIGFLIELSALGGRNVLPDCEFFSLISY
jgi:adenine phosphoribosyltransferase